MRHLFIFSRTVLIRSKLVFLSYTNLIVHSYTLFILTRYLTSYYYSMMNTKFWLIFRASILSFFCAVQINISAYICNTAELVFQTYIKMSIFGTTDLPGSSISKPYFIMPIISEDQATSFTIIWAFFVDLHYIGSITATFLLTPSADRWGRRKTLIISMQIALAGECTFRTA